MTPALLRQFVAEASVSPSVHNVQPARWRIEGEGLVLLEDRQRRLAVGDPRGHDAALSLGAAAEGLVLAASRAGYATTVERLSGEEGTLLPVARFVFAPYDTPDPLGDVLSARASWRGPFKPVSPMDRDAARALAGADRTIVVDPAAIAAIAAAYDKASYAFICQQSFRRELRSWMRLSRRHPRWQLDGLNAAAMKLSRFEAFGARFVLGPLFAPLAAIGLAPTLLSESASFAHAAGIALFHRPTGEDPFESGRHFHRLWLEMEAAGFGANVLAALADDAQTATRLHTDFDLPQDHRLISAFCFGRRDGEAFAPARLPTHEILLA